jgi:hypothetical protein
MIQSASRGLIVKYALAVFVLLCLVLASGCGGNSPSGPSRFAGNWAGSLTVADQPTQSTPVTLTITTSGQATGVIKPSQGFTTGLGGWVADNGDVYLVNSEINPLPDPIIFTGKVSLSSTGRMVGQFSGTRKGVFVVTVTIDAARQ